MIGLGAIGRLCRRRSGHPLRHNGAAAALFPSGHILNGLFIGIGLWILGVDLALPLGVIVFFGGPAADREYYARLAAGTAESVHFGAPRESDAAQEWRAHLAGMMLKRSNSYYSGGNDGGYVGGSSSQTLHLCNDGTYAYLSHSTVAADAGGGTSGEFDERGRP